MCKWTVGKIRGEECIPFPEGAAQEKFRSRGPTSADCRPCCQQALWASRAGVFPQGPHPKENPDHGPGWGQNKNNFWQVTGPRKLCPSHWGCLPRGSHQAQRTPARSDPFLPSGSQALGALAGEKAQRKPGRNETVLLKKGMALGSWPPEWLTCPCSVKTRGVCYPGTLQAPIRVAHGVLRTKPLLKFQGPE